MGGRRYGSQALVYDAERLIRDVMDMKDALCLLECRWSSNDTHQELDALRLNVDDGTAASECLGSGLIEYGEFWRGSALHDGELSKSSSFILPSTSLINSATAFQKSKLRRLPGDCKVSGETVPCTKQLEWVTGHAPSMLSHSRPNLPLLHSFLWASMTPRGSK